MNYTLKELLDLFDAQTINIATYIQTTYNDLVPTDYSLTTDKATSISKIMKYMLNQWNNVESVFDNAESGISIIKSIITTHIMSIVLEYERIDISLKENLMTEHSQEKFNPIDNDEIEKAPIAKDDLRFNKLDNFNAKLEIMSKSSVINEFLADIRTILHTMF